MPGDSAALCARWSFRRPRVHRLSTHRLAAGLLRRPDHGVIGITWGPVSLLWDRAFKRAQP